MNLTTRTYKPSGLTRSADGIFIQNVTIMEAKAFYTENCNSRSANSPVHDIGIRLKLDVGRSFYPEMTISGNFKKDQMSGEVIDWGSAFVVNDFLVKVGVTTDGQSLTNDNKIPDEWVAALVGKQFFRLSYQAGINPSTGKARYYDWNQITVGEKGIDALRKKFLAQVEQNRIRNYHPQTQETTISTAGTMMPDPGQPF